MYVSNTYYYYYHYCYYVYIYIYIHILASGHVTYVYSRAGARTATCIL